MTKKLVIINGAPGSGKTTLTSVLRSQLAVPIIEKDAIKEFYFDYVGIGDREWSRALGKASIDALFSLVDQLFTVCDQVIIETAFYGEPTRQDVSRLREHHDIDILELYCSVDETTRRQRFESRAKENRHPGHADLLAPHEAAENIDRYQPLKIGEFINIDTANFDVETDGLVVAARVRTFIGEKA